MQGYTEMGDTSTTTVRQALINHEENINSIRSGNSGESFPADAVAGMRCYRADEDKEYIYDGKEWYELAKAGDVATVSKDLSDAKTNADSTYATKKQAGVPYQIKRNTAYNVGDVLTSPDLPPGYIIVVTTAGTTGSTEPDWDSIRKSGGVVSDGTTAYKIVSVNGLADSKQDKLKWDSTPTSGSSNPVTSDGVAKALDGKQAAGDYVKYDNSGITLNENNSIAHYGGRNIAFQNQRVQAQKSSYTQDEATYSWEELYFMDKEWYRFGLLASHVLVDGTSEIYLRTYSSGGSAAVGVRKKGANAAELWTDATKICLGNGEIWLQ